MPCLSSVHTAVTEVMAAQHKDGLLCCSRHHWLPYLRPVTGMWDPWSSDFLDFSLKEASLQLKSDRYQQKIVFQVTEIFHWKITTFRNLFFPPVKYFRLDLLPCWVMGVALDSIHSVLPFRLHTFARGIAPFSSVKETAHLGTPLVTEPTAEQIQL